MPPRLTACASLAGYVLATGLPDRLFRALPAVMLGWLAVAAGLGAATLAEAEAARAVFTAAGLRLIAVSGAVLFLATHLRGAFARREVEFMLTTPLTRAGFVAGYGAGAAVLLLVIAAMATALLALAGPDSPTGLAAWGASLGLELAIIGAATLLAALMLESAAASALAALAFYGLCRMIGGFAGAAESLAPGSPWTRLGQGVTEALAVLLPRLDLFGQSAWPVQGPPAPAMMGLLALQAGIWLALIGAAAALDFGRRTL